MIPVLRMSVANVPRPPKIHASRQRVDSLPDYGMADTLEEAQAQFKTTFNKYRDAGVVSGPGAIRRFHFVALPYESDFP